MSARRSNRSPWVLFGVCLVVYTLTAYGGIRSTDSEIVFQSARSLVRDKTLAVERGVYWEGFGVAEGIDGRRYPVFGPARALLLAPLVWVSEKATATGWYEDLPLPLHPSHQVAQGLFYYVGSVAPRDLEPHALRLLPSLLNVAVTALAVLVFWHVLRGLEYSPRASTLTAVVLAFGSLLWPYSGTLFSEPAATLLVLLSFLGILRSPGRPGGGLLVLSGAALGAAVAVHVTAVLSFPFFLLLAAGRDLFSRGWFGTALRPALLFCLGFSLPVALLGYHNLVHFGSVFETGRAVDPAAAGRLFYGRFTWPFVGLYGLLLGGAKGLFVTSPSAVLGVAGWPAFARRHGYLAHVLLAMILFRVLFIAGRSDWHGGYSLGPRYLVMILPFLLLPVAGLLDGPQSPRISPVTAAVVLAGLISVQFHFALGEIFTYYYLLKWTFAPDGIAALADLGPYIQWKYSPLLSLPAQYRGPWLLEAVPLGNRALWALVTALLVPLCGLLVRQKE